ncbi:Vps53 [Blattamonas nauphoetae]|uniref:Vps53 n=1 Tax=Blattamonas nauphoetae TaxID=2049346 RepID=A0ABQ9YA87_9EUKA|nr:Vps53 [Blattamonas nauphoetae]
MSSGEVSVSWDYLDREDFNPIDFVNSMFKSEESLSQLGRVAVQVKTKIYHLETEINDALNKQSVSRQKGKEELDKAHGAISNLREKIQEIKTKSLDSEQMVKTITSEISHLDLGKKNLQNSISSLNKLQMLITSIDTLQTLVAKRQYPVLKDSLTSTIMLVEFFSKFNIPQITAVIEQYRKLTADLQKYLTADINGLTELGANLSDQETAKLKGACECITVLGDDFRTEITSNVCSTILRPYKREFGELGPKYHFKNVIGRYTWLKKTIQQLDQRKNIFPQCWSLQSHFCYEFCLITKTDIEQLLKQDRNLDPTISGHTDVSIIVNVLEETLRFEEDLEIYVKSLQFSDNEIEALPSNTPQKETEYEDKNFSVLAKKTATKEKKGKDGGADQEWKAQMERAKFLVNIHSPSTEEDKEEFGSEMTGSSAAAIRARWQKESEEKKRKKQMEEAEQKKMMRQKDIELRAQQGDRSGLIPPFTPSFTSLLSSAFIPSLDLVVQQEKKELAALNADLIDKAETAKDEGGAMVYNSAPKLFKRIKTGYTNMKKLSRGKVMFDTSVVFMDSLTDYLRNLVHLLPKSIHRYCDPSRMAVKNFPQYSPDVIILTSEEDTKICTVMNTITYVFTTTEELVKSIVGSLDEEFKSKVSARAPQDVSQQLLTLTQECLCYSILTKAEPSLSQMPVTIQKIQDGGMNTMESPYVREFSEVLVSSLTPLASVFYDIRWKRFIGLLVKNVGERMWTLFSTRVKKLSMTASDQLLVDTENIITTLREIPKILNKPADLLYSQQIQRSFDTLKKTINIIKTHQDLLLSSFTEAFPDGTRESFSKILELKQIKRDQRQTLLDEFDKLKKTKS